MSRHAAMIASSTRPRSRVIDKGHIQLGAGSGVDSSAIFNLILATRFKLISLSAQASWLSCFASVPYDRVWR